MLLLDHDLGADPLPPHSLMLTVRANSADLGCLLEFLGWPEGNLLACLDLICLTPSILVPASKLEPSLNEYLSSRHKRVASHRPAS